MPTGHQRPPARVSYGKQSTGLFSYFPALADAIRPWVRCPFSAAASGAVCQWQTSSTDRRGSGDRALNGAHWAPAPPATFEKVDETFTRLRRARELIIRTGVSVAHRPKARLARGATPATCQGCNPRGRALTVRTGTAFSRRSLARFAWGATPADVRYRVDEHERSELPLARFAWGATP